MKTKCPKCNVVYDVDDSHLDNILKCACGNEFIAQRYTNNQERRPITNKPRTIISNNITNSVYNHPMICRVLEVVWIISVCIGLIIAFLGIVNVVGTPSSGVFIGLTCIFSAVPVAALEKIIDLLARIENNTQK